MMCEERDEERKGGEGVRNDKSHLNISNTYTFILLQVIKSISKISHIPFLFPPFLSSLSYPLSYPQTSLHLPKSQHHELSNIKSSQIKSWHEKNPRPSANQGRIVDACMY
jgi:hypothetical protein